MPVKSCKKFDNPAHADYSRRRKRGIRGHRGGGVVVRAKTNAIRVQIAAVQWSHAKKALAIMSLKEIRLPRFPECWETCGNCGQGEVFVLELLVRPGDRIARDDTILILETGKVALDISSPFAGVVREVRVRENEELGEGALLATVEVADMQAG